MMQKSAKIDKKHSRPQDKSEQDKTEQGKSDIAKKSKETPFKERRDLLIVDRFIVWLK